MDNEILELVRANTSNSLQDMSSDDLFFLSISRTAAEQLPIAARLRLRQKVLEALSEAVEECSQDPLNF